MNKKFYAVLYKTLHGFVGKVLFPTKVYRYYEGIPEGPVVLASNHLAGKDILILMAASRRQLRFMAKKELFKIPLLRTLMKAMGAFPVDRKSGGISAIRRGQELLKEGEVVGIFPQGTRCAGVHPRETLGKLHGGAALLADRTHATILPVSILTKKFKIGFFKRVYVSFGTPITYEEYAPILEREDGRMALTRLAFEQTCDMIDADIERYKLQKHFNKKDNNGQ